MCQLSAKVKLFLLRGGKVMRKRDGFFVLGLLICAILFVSGNLGAQQANQPTLEKKGIVPLPAEELKVRLIEVQDERGITPKVLVSGKGTTVIWYNTTDGPIHIRFQRGDQVKVACAEPRHFVMQEDQSFQSEEIPFGGSASLCFLEPGNYEYTITGVTAKPFKTAPEFDKLGTIVIK
jgi:hypothetical protein